MSDINPPSSRNREKGLASPRDGSNEKNKSLDNDSDAENVPLSDDNGKNKPPCPATKNDYGHNEEKTAKADEKSGDEFDHGSDSREQFRLIMDQMLNMDDETFNKKYPPPKNPRKPMGPKEAFKLLEELCEDTDDEDESNEAAPGGSQPTKKEMK
ncbi:hypothetical protein V496_06871 [Pseudogymnoascus sp. VKM F-4515 (FW-2607)]|nr:hypothetical protein V496_06871 [Pseudogymnoascus sp. VKM F-4515 (FW-2607)]